MRKKSETIKIYNEAKEFYLNNNITLTELEKKFHICSKSFKKFLTKEGIDYTQYTKQAKLNSYKYQNDLNIDYFKNINSEIKAYILGFILADGNISKNRLKIAISDIDESILKIFINDCKYKGPINKYFPITSRLPLSEISIFGKEFVKNLIDKNLTENKSTREVPYYNIDDKLINHYIRGIFDGDGWVNYTKSSHSKEFGICNSLEVCEFIYNIFKAKLNIIGKISKNNTKKDNNLYRVRYFKKDEFIKIYNFIYSDSTIYLNRKFEKMKNIIAVLDEIDK